MKQPPRRQLDREAAALVELGRTQVSARLAPWIVGVFIGMLAVFFVGELLSPLWRADRSRPLIWQFGEEVGAAVQRSRAEINVGNPGSSILALNRNIRSVLADWEDRPEEDAWIADGVRPRVQQILTSVLGLGNEQVYLGKDGWLFYRHDVDALLMPPLSEVERGQRIETILQTAADLAERGIQLVLMPTPVKPTVHGRFLNSRMGENESIRPAAEAALLDLLQAQGIAVFDPLPALRDLDRNHGSAISYLKTDTHWSPEGAEAVAAALAVFLTERGWVNRGNSHWVRGRIEHTAQGDTLALLGLPAASAAVRAETVELWVVGEESTHPPIAAGSSVLLLGDSFSNHLSLEAMGWGESGGLAEHLAWHLRRPIDRIARNDAGASASRHILSRELARGYDRLEGVQVLIWQFAAREWVFGDWDFIPMELGERQFSDFLDLAPDQSLRVRGLIREASPVPRPGSVPYADHIRSLHLIDLIDLAGNPLAASEAVVYLRSMERNAWTEAARLRAGQEVELELTSWRSVEARFGGLNRSDLEDIELQLVDPLWGEIFQ